MARVTFLNHTDGITAYPGPGVARVDAGAAGAPHHDYKTPTSRIIFKIEDSSIGARRAGGEARFEALTTFSCGVALPKCVASG